MIRTTFRIAIIAGLAFSITASIPAQAQWFQGAGYIAAGVSGTSTGKLNDMLTASGYPAFGGTAADISIGAYATIARRILLGAEWNGLILGEQQHQQRSVWLGGGYGTLGAAYAVNISRPPRIYPLLGIGIGGLGLLFESSEDTVAFRDVLADADGQADLSRGFEPSLTREHSVVDIGAGAEFLSSRSGRGTLIGLRLGYVVAPSSSRWQLNHRAVSDGPSATMAGPYVRVLLGLGAWR